MTRYFFERTNIASAMALRSGTHTIAYEFIPDAAKPGTGGKSILSVDGKKVAEGQIPNNACTGRIVKVTVEQK